MEDKEIHNLFKWVMRWKGHKFPQYGNRFLIIDSYDLTDTEIQLVLISGYGINKEREKHTVKREDADGWFKQIMASIAPRAHEEPRKLVPVVKATPQPTKAPVDYPKDFANKNYKYSLKMSDQTENRMETLRTSLFSALQKLEAGTMKADEAKAMASIAQTLLNSAKLELEYKRLVEKNPKILMLE